MDIPHEKGRIIIDPFLYLSKKYKPDSISNFINKKSTEMKKVISLVIIFLFISACSKKEQKFELFNPEAFTYNLEPGWELNASVRVKGYELIENNDKYSMNLYYYADVVTPLSDTLKNIASGNVDKTSNEEFPDVGIDVQADFDSTHSVGNYKIIFHVKDVNTGKSASAEKVFNVTN